MKTPFEYIYNRVYRIFKFLGGNKNPHVSSCLYLSFLLVFVLDIISNLFISARELFISDGLLYILGYTFFALIIYYLTVYNNKYLSVIEKFENEKLRSIILGNIMVISISVFVFAYALTPIFIIAQELYGN